MNAGGFFIFVTDRLQSFSRKEMQKVLFFFDLLNDSAELRYLRKNLMIALKQHGDGLQHLEETTRTHINELLDKIEGKGDEAFLLRDMIKTTFGNLLMTLTYGFGSDDGLKRMAEWEKKGIELFDDTGPCMVLNCCPPLRYFVPSVKQVHNESLEHIKKYADLFNAFSDERNKDYDRKNPKFYIDHFINLLNKPVRIGPGK